MAIQTINLTVPGGDTPRSANTKINANFSDQTNAASKSIGLARKELAHNENLFEAMYGSTTGGNIVKYSTTGAANINDSVALAGKRVEITAAELAATTSAPTDVQGVIFILETKRTGAYSEQTLYEITGTSSSIYKRLMWGAWKGWVKQWNSANATRDSNGFLKAASPIVKVFADKVELNGEAVEQNVTYKKNGIGDYTITTVSGLSTDGWYIELPKDMNGNPKVAIGTLDDKDGVITLKTYKRIFSMETFTFEPDLDNPLDVPDGRWIDLRLNEIPVEEVNP